MFRLTHLIALTALALLLAASSRRLTAAEGSVKADKPAAATGGNPLDPFSEDDPFVGTFEDDEMQVVIRHEAGKYSGEVLKAGRSFPFAGTRRGNALSGSFEFGGKQYDFVVTADAGGVAFSTTRRLRKAAGDAVVPTPSPAPVPAPTTTSPTPAPRTPTTTGPLTRVPDPVRPAAPTPRPAPVTPPSLEKTYEAEPGKAWTGFPVGSYVTLEDTSSNGGTIGEVMRMTLVFEGVSAGKEMVQRIQFTGAKWAPLGKPTPWMGTGMSMEELGYKAGKTSQDTLTVDNATIACTVTEYTRQEQKAGRTRTAGMQLWRARSITLPPQTLVLPEGLLLVEPGVVRVMTLPDDWRLTDLDFKLTTLKQPHRIDNQQFDVAVFQGAETTDSLEGKIITTHERFLTPRVPGGLAKFIFDKRRGGESFLATSGVAVDFGTSRPQAASGK